MGTADHTEPLKLPDTVKYVFEECRMVLPGIQALRCRCRWA
jgi:hypothetical protein